MSDWYRCLACNQTGYDSDGPHICPVNRAGWVCPVCGAGVAPSVAFHCEPVAAGVPGLPKGSEA